MSSKSWPFSDSKDVAAFSSKHIFKDQRPILHVTHDEDDGAWQFHSGTPTSASDAMIVSLEEVFEHDPSIGGLADLPLGWQAKRITGEHPWVRSRTGN
jgi:hypothetical protein